MEKLARGNALHVLDMLIARMKFERAGVKLYDAVIDKIERSADTRYRVLLDQLRKNRNDEQEHAQWLEAQIRALGGSPERATDLSELEELESKGIQSVILDGHDRILHNLHALLTAEQADNAGWDLLVQLAADAGDSTAKAAFNQRLLEEAKHVAYLREAIHRAAEIEMLGLPAELPESVGSAMLAKARSPLAAGAIAIGVAGTALAGAALFRRATTYISAHHR
jgi:bacterioferritin (cytochrome b1)